MYIVPNDYTPSTGSVAPPSPVGTSGDDEYSAQLGFLLGYLNVLLVSYMQNQGNPDPNTVNEIKSVIAQLNAGAQSPNCDPTIAALIKSSDINTIFGANGQIQMGPAIIFNDQWVDGNNDGPCLASGVIEWLTGKDTNGQIPFDPAQAQDPNTMFYLLMFLSVVDQSPAAVALNYTPFNEEGTAPSPIGWAQSAAYFVQAYLQAQGSNAPNIEELERAMNGASPNSFAQQFTAALTNSNGWTPPSGQTPTQAEAALLTFLDQYLN